MFGDAILKRTTLPLVVRDCLAEKIASTLSALPA